MNIRDFALHILTNGDLESKLISVDLIDWDQEVSWVSQKFEGPARCGKITFSKDQVKFPGRGALKHNKERGKALHFFANHELLAIEMMAQAILQFPEMTKSQQKLLMNTLSEEQKHFNLYRKRMNDFGVEFGDYPLNNFFWSFIEHITTLESFFSVISLTFEQANLDFASHYKKVFEEIGDNETAGILQVVYEDEIKHVARGRVEVMRAGVLPEELWEFYTKTLPHNLTPSRAKGMSFDREGRIKAGLNEDYIEKLLNYKNEFSITNRKQWKS